MYQASMLAARKNAFPVPPNRRPSACQGGYLRSLDAGPAAPGPLQLGQREPQLPVAVATAAAAARPPLLARCPTLCNASPTTHGCALFRIRSLATKWRVEVAGPHPARRVLVGLPKRQVRRACQPQHSVSCSVLVAVSFAADALCASRRRPSPGPRTVVLAGNLCCAAASNSCAQCSGLWSLAAPA